MLYSIVPRRVVLFSKPCSPNNVLGGGDVAHTVSLHCFLLEVNILVHLPNRQNISATLTKQIDHLMKTYPADRPSQQHLPSRQTISATLTQQVDHLNNTYSADRPSQQHLLSRKIISGILTQQKDHLGDELTLCVLVDADAQHLPSRKTISGTLTQ